MLIITFIVALAASFIAAIVFVRGLMQLYHNNEKSRGSMASVLIIGRLAVIASAVIFALFNL